MQMLNGDFAGKKSLLSMVISVAMSEAQLTQKSLLNRAAFCPSTWKNSVFGLTDSTPDHIDSS